MTSILIVGAGAIGTFLASNLAASGKSVAIIARGSRLKELQRPTNLRSGSTRTAFAFRAITWKEIDHCPDLVILCTKTYDLEETLKLLVKHVDNQTVILTLQNGISAPFETARVFGSEQVLAGRLHGFFELKDGSSRHVGVAPTILLGPLTTGEAKLVQPVCQTLTESGMPASPSDDIEKELWEKLMLTASLGGVCAALGVTAGKVLADSSARLLLRNAMEEIAELGRLRGVRLEPDCVERTLAFVGTFPYDATTSLHRDLKAGHRSEYDALTGGVLTMAKAVGMPTPALAQIDTLIACRGFL
jgi:2-dehydropantoate 2-reductase